MNRGNNIKPQNNSDKTDPVLASGAMVGILLLATFLRLYRLEVQSLGFDESYSLAVGLADWGTLFQATLSSGVHPPLFYIIHKTTLALWGSSEFAQRFGAAVFSLLSVALVYRAGTIILNHKMGLLSALLLALNPLHVWLAQEARMYSLLGTLALVSMIAFWQAIHTNRRWFWIILAVTNSLMFGLHYFGFLIAIIQFGFILLTFTHNYHYLRLWTIIQAIAFLLLLPWLVFIAFRESQTFGIGFLLRPTLLDFLVTYWNLSLGSSYLLWPVAILVIGINLVALTLASRPFPPHKVWLRQAQLLLSLWVLMPPSIVWLISQRRSFYADRYLSFIIPALVLLAAFGVNRIVRPGWRTWLTSGLVIASSYGLVTTYLDPTFWKDDWRSAITYVNQNEQPGDVILLYTAHIQFVFNYYYRGAAPRKPISLNLDKFQIEPLVANHQRAWVVYPYTRPPTHYPMQPLRPNGFWLNDPDRNPYLVDWLEAKTDQIITYQHWPGIEIWLVDLR
jgi:uncharacterized membrane protein